MKKHINMVLPEAMFIWVSIPGLSVPHMRQKSAIYLYLTSMWKSTYQYNTGLKPTRLLEGCTSSKNTYKLLKFHLVYLHISRPVGFLKGGMKMLYRQAFPFSKRRAHCQFFCIIALVIPCGYLAGTCQVSQENNGHPVNGALVVGWPVHRRLSSLPLL
jgi:hypothetical protein